MLLEPELRARLERLSLGSRRRVRGMWSGRHASVQRGESLDFADYREYVPGDDFRRIDHNLRARLGVVLVRLFEAEDELPVRLVCDGSGSMKFGAKFDTARTLAAAIAYMALAGGDRVYPAAIPGPNGAPLTSSHPARHLGSWPRVEAWFEALKPGGPTDLVKAVRALRGQGIARGPVVLCSDLLTDGWEKALDLIGATGSGGVVLHVLAPEEMEPELTGDLRLVDSETGETVEISTSEASLDAYRTALNEFIARAAARARRNGLDYVLVVAEPGAVVDAISALAAVEIVR